MRDIVRLCEAAWQELHNYQIYPCHSQDQQKSTLVKLGRHLLK